MRVARAQFKLALRECRASEDRLRTEALAKTLTDKNMTGYWDVVKKLGPKANKLTNKLDDVTGDEQILKMWREKYSALFNSVDPHNCHRDILDTHSFSEFLTVNEISNAVKKLSKNKAVGMDAVPSEVFYFCIA